MSKWNALRDVLAEAQRRRVFFDRGALFCNMECGGLPPLSKRGLAPVSQKHKSNYGGEPP